MEDIIITTPEKLQTLVNNAVRSVLPELMTYMKPDTNSESDYLDGAQAASEFLTKQGFTFSRGGIYSLVHQDRIPYSKFGRKTIFSKKRLIEWTKSKMNAPDSRANAMYEIEKNAHCKDRRK